MELSGICDLCGKTGKLSTCMLCGKRICMNCSTPNSRTCKNCISGRMQDNSKTLK
ncbi:MAG: orotate phosphoribosyltransferase [Candidatus Altiarchaeales archaeon]|nr:orotate phosphoribosyltransferase [Candidatus Altiarchaeales archaeon]